VDPTEAEQKNTNTESANDLLVDSNTPQAEESSVSPATAAKDQSNQHPKPPASEQIHASANTTPELVDQPQAFQTVEGEAYWIERRRYLRQIKKIPELRQKYVKAALAYLIRRFLWSFTFFPVFIAFWIPLVLNRFNLVVTINKVLPSMQTFVEANPEAQAATVETLVLAWFSIGITFAIFDVILTPFKNPYEHEVEIHMRTWEKLHFHHKNNH